MSDVSASVRARLPEWARYEGYATYALAAYLYTAAMAVLAAIAAFAGNSVAAIGGVVLALPGWVFAGYYASAAKLRVECDQCGGAARGASVCPHCGERTYTGGTQ